MRIARYLFGTLALAWLAGCTVAPDPDSLDYDPLEQSNRLAHENNKQIDKAIFQPVARTYGQIPAPMRKGVTNLRYNWKLPGQAIQSVLQMRGTQTAETVTRFMINTSLGLGGLLDPAAEMGLPYRETNFDETFEVWGVPEGDPLAFKVYQPDRTVLGKRMEDHLRPGVCFWHSFSWDGRDMFGIGTLDRPWLEDSDEMAGARTRMAAAFEFFSKLGTPYYCFHDRDVAPEGDTFVEFRDNLDALADDALKRREVALYSGGDNREGLQLLSPTHYLRQALAPTADLLDGALEDILPANPDVIILADVATLSGSEAAALQDWVEKGGLLLRFAGPRLAASDIAREQEDPLLPVRLRAGGRSIGGAMSWGDPRALRPFAPGSPFYGLTIPGDVRVTAQVLAQPDPSLAERTVAALDDGTPLVTRKPLGQGQVVLFHVTANAEWSSLPLSGLFVQMLERLAVSTRPAVADAAELQGTVWQAERLLDGFGAFRDAGQMAGIAGEKLAGARPGPDTPPGIYRSEDRLVALNAISAGQAIAAARWPAGTDVEGLVTERPRALKGPALMLALALLAIDLLAALWLSGRLTGPRGLARAAMLVAALWLLPSPQASAQDDTAFAIDATASTVLAYVETGDARTDRVSAAGLKGLSDTLYARTTIEPADPIGVDLETDELAFFPMLYWPVTPDQPLPSDEAYARLNRYLRTGGMIVFDTRDADSTGFGAASANAAKLRALALPLDIPPLEVIPEDHILTRTFYLLQDFPGRYTSREVWVEAAPPGAERAEGMPFRNLNDNVTPVVIGGNDWAAAWAVDERGDWMFPIGRGLAGAHQREIALRWGVNLVMHVLTGNYKSDQVHVPALLERLGQ